MNNSDYSNPRRLIRAIEISESKQQQIVSVQPFETMWCGLTAPKEYITDRIAARVHHRIKQDFTQELMVLQQQYPNFLELPAGNTLGYQEWGKYLTTEWTQAEAIAHWIINETAYAKRQLTWFNKQSDVTWFDITHKTWYAQTRDQLERWINYGTYYS
jgi:tRNA dimethylallyltransferase